jgi:hypothetical protein
LPIPAQAERDRANTASITNEISLFMLSPPFIRVVNHRVVIDQRSHIFLWISALRFWDWLLLSEERLLFLLSKVLTLKDYSPWFGGGGQEWSAFLRTPQRLSEQGLSQSGLAGHAFMCNQGANEIKHRFLRKKAFIL